MILQVKTTTNVQHQAPLEGPGLVALGSDGKPFVAENLAAVATALETIPEIPAEPTAQDVVDALVALGLATQAEPEE